jgi:uncharacterized membrane protein YhhN
MSLTYRVLMPLSFSLCTGLCLLAVSALVWSCGSASTTTKDGAGWRWQVKAVSKTIASIFFILAGYAKRAESSARSTGIHGSFVLVGLVLSMGGDVALLFTGERAFLCGLGFFLLAHLAYIPAFVVYPGSFSLRRAVLAGALLVAPCLAWVGQRLLEGSNVPSALRLPVSVYMTVIGVMWAASFGVGSTKSNTARLGATLFVVSDLFVANSAFGGVFPPAVLSRASPGNELLGLPLYYFAQLVIAYSI